MHVASSNLVSRSISPADDARARIRASAERLRAALARTVTADPALAAAAADLSAGYRAGREPAGGAGHVHDPRGAAAYAAIRMPATFAAVGRAMAEAALALPAFAPASLLDVGAGTGAAAWAAAAVWPGLVDMVAIDREPAMIELGRRLAAPLRAGEPDALGNATWRVVEGEAGSFPASDVVAAAYLLGELGDPGDRAALVSRLWEATAGALVLVEPGSRPGFGRILAARSLLIEAGATIAAPCPGNVACPVQEPAWCHFLARLDRSPLHQRAKRAVRSWEDEPFSYVVATRAPSEPRPRIVLGRPRQRPGQVELRICRDGRIETRIVSRREGPAWRIARDLGWGDRLPADLDASRHDARDVAHGDSGDPALRHLDENGHP
ncbi:MAG TPA: small ribosomal subunit Rsm22 family protein [Candidatus Limnocylindrales bacterium]|nr:small ribosomal subunit Rsm22 family protein [Candidatus Limnocylindrales bacterium]